jgi:hypothetical protein
MIPAPLRAPPTGITDAGYKVRQGVFVLANHELTPASAKAPAWQAKEHECCGAAEF